MKPSQPVQSPPRRASAQPAHPASAARPADAFRRGRAPSLHALVETGRLCATQAFSGGILNVLGTWMLRAVSTIVLLHVWRSMLAEGAGTEGMTVDQVLTYVLLSAILSEQLNVVSPASMAFWEGTLANRYTRPLSVVAQLVAETMGRWVPHLLFFSLPMLAVSPLLGVRVLPASPAAGLCFALGLVLAIGLGFALDLVFASLALYIKNAGWMALMIRNAFFTLFSGALIPFRLLPWGLGDALELLPFGSLANAPLSLFIGSGDPVRPLLLQLLWNLLLWPFALWLWHHSEERMVAYGG